MIRIASRTEAERLLGKGLYTPAEAARYARVPTQLLTRWIHGNKQGSPVVESEVTASHEKIVTFLDFVQALAIRRIRRERPQISLNKIRQAYVVASKEFNVKYPFALESTHIGLFGPQDKPELQEIWLCVGKSEEGTLKYFQLTGKKRKNQLIGEVVRTYTSRLVFDDITKLATRYFAFPPITPGDSVSANTQRVIMEPDIRFGEPYIASCGYTAQTLFDAYQAEGSVERAAELSGVTREEVILAIEYIDYLQEPKLRDTASPVSS
jgi:uncharacterized protein (DUF433 family)